MVINDKKYQVWLTEVVLNGADPASEYHPGYELQGTYATIEEAVDAVNKIPNGCPVITKTVVWKTTVTDVTEPNPLAGGLAKSEYDLSSLR